MTTYIPIALRRLVIERADNCCEYCKVSQEDRFLSYEVDHIIAEKHGGDSSENNLCWSCYICNGFKGSDIGSIDWEGTGQLTPLYHPRQQHWEDHFFIDGIEIIPLTAEGRVTIYLLHLNSVDTLIERDLRKSQGRYPCDH